MSDLEHRLSVWRGRDSLQFLATKLGKTPKQIGRYCDLGLVPGTYRTPKRHRRIRYTCDTVERVRLKVAAAKRKNIEIRYHTNEVIYGDTTINARRCNSMQDLYIAAGKAGLTKAQASELAFSPPEDVSVAAEDISWETLCASEGLSTSDIENAFRSLPRIPADKDLSTAAFAWGSAYHLIERMSETDSRKSNDPKLYAYAMAHAQVLPRRAQLWNAAFALRRQNLPLTAGGLAMQLGVSRPALYREFKKEGIRQTLGLVWKILPSRSERRRMTDHDCLRDR